MGKFAVPILVLAGTVVGAFFGNPELGALIGGIAGQLLFPTQLPTQYGPKLQDTANTASNVGAPIPRGWGTFPAGGCIIVKTDLIETIEETHQGKGGPQQTTETPQYHQTFAIGINDGLIAGVRVIWANGKPIFDRRPQGFNDTGGTAETDIAYQARMAASDQLESQFTLYLGTEVQLADPVLEAFYGVGNISAFRGLAYIVFHNWLNKAEDGNRMPSQWKFEVYGEGDRANTAPYVYDIPSVIPWVSGEVPWSGPNDGTEFLFGIVTFVNGESFFTPDFNTFEEACGALDVYLSTPTFAASPPTNSDYFPGRPSCNNIMGVNAYAKGYQTSPPNFLNTTPGGEDMTGTFADRDFAYVAVNSMRYTNGLVLTDLDNATVQALTLNEIYRWDTGSNSGVVMHVLNEAEAIRLGNPNFDGGNDLGDGTWGISARNHYVRVIRLFKPPPDPCFARPDVPGASNYCVTALGEIAVRGDWEQRAIADGLSLREAIRIQGVGAGADTSVRGVGPLVIDNSDDDNEDFWVNQYNAAVIRGDMPPGLVYGTDYPQLTDPYYRRPAVATGTINTQDISLGTIVSDICIEAGLAGKINTSQLTQRVQGYVRTSVNPARGAIDPLRQAYFFDGIESNGVLVFRTRGAAVGFTLTEDDLAAAIINDSDVGASVTNNETSRMKVTDTDDMQLPAQVRVHYLSSSREYEAGEQDSPYRSDTLAKQIVDVQVPIVLTDSQAMQIAQSLWAQSWVERTSYTTVIDAAYQQLEPADPIAIPVDGRVVRARITQINETLPATRSLQLVADEAAAFISYAISNPTVPIPRPVLSIVLPADAYYLDIPGLVATDNDAGFYVAIYGQIPSEFTGAGVYRSTDGGGEYGRAVQDGPPSCTVGTMAQALPAGPTDIFDETSELFCELLDKDGALFSATEAQVIAGQNAVACGVDGRWEIVQYKNAVQVSSGQNTNIWKLTGLLRGRRGTEWTVGLSQAGDLFTVLLGCTRVPLDATQIGNVLKYKIVSTGSLIDGTAPTEFTSHGMSLKPFSVVAITGERDTPSANDWTMDWIRRDRIGQTLQGHEIAMSEVAETYEIDILNGSTVVRTLTVTGETEITYQAAEQVTDFGSHQSSIHFIIYQMSATVGRGIGAEATLP